MCDRIFVLKLLYFEICILWSSQANSEMTFSFYLKNEKSATGRAQEVRFKQRVKAYAKAQRCGKSHVF